MAEQKRILIGEDDQTILRMTKLRLEHEGYDVLVADSSEEVLRQVGADPSARPVHLILLDVKMPTLNGYAICRELRRTPTTAGIPIIIFSASEPELQHLANHCIEVGATDWIKKPFRAKDLLAKVHRALRDGEGGGNG